MNLAKLTSRDLKKIVVLLERKESWLARLGKIDKDLAAYDSEPTFAPAAEPAAKPAQKARRSRTRGRAKAAILELLQEAGSSGLKVKDIASSLGVNPGRIHVWFSANKKIRQIKKIGVGHYAWVA